ncbi:MAG: hypothetical protein ACREEM_10210, partial [Blastocatellia bacterium]
FPFSIFHLRPRGACFSCLKMESGELRMENAGIRPFVPLFPFVPYLFLSIFEIHSLAFEFGDRIG